MAVSKRKEKENKLLRERVLDVAEEIIATDGVRHMTMRRIASKIDYAPTVLYRLFADKNDLMDHLIVRGYGGVRARYDEVMDRIDLEPLQKLEALLNAYYMYGLDHPNHYQMWFVTSNISVEKGRLKMHHGRLDFKVFQPWLDCIEACRAAGHFAGRDKFQVFQVLWPRLHGVISLRLQHPEFRWPPAEKHLEEVLDLGRLARGSESDPTWSRWPPSK
jgi:AcrR family transcriptional regulator